MGLETHIIEELQKQRNASIDACDLAWVVAAAPFIGVVNLPLAVVITVISAAGAAAADKKNLSDTVMPDEWLQSVAASSEVSPAGLAFLSKIIAKNGHVSISDALKFVELENEIEANKGRDAAKAEAKKAYGAKSILERAKRECGSLIDQNTIDSALDIMKLGGNIVGSMVSALKMAGANFSKIEPSNTIPEALKFIARAESVECPLCNHINMSLLGDPRGKECECSGCNEIFKVSAEALPVIE